MAKVGPVKFPGPTDRLAVIGRTGSGKTTAAAWHLSGRDFDLQPWIIVNTKGDPLLYQIAAIPGVNNISVDDTPGERGLYHIDPTPDDAERLNAFFGRVWQKQNCGIYIDEGYMITNTEKLNACLTQGRSRQIPMIILSQRPAWITKFVFSEADFVQLFNLSRLEDRKNVGGLVPVDKNYRLPPYESYWYNVGDDDLKRFAPVPNASVILENFRAKFPPEQALVGEEPPAQRKQATRRVV